MMAHMNKFVAAVKQDGKVLRDTKGNNNERKVFIKFNSEYELYLKNMTNKRCGVEVDIDGCRAVEGMLVIDANSGLDLERFMLDGDMKSGNRLKFVSVDSSNEGLVDPSSPDNGLIEVRFFEERDWTYHTLHYPIGRPPCDPGVPSPIITCGTGGPSYESRIFGATADCSADPSPQVNFVHASMPVQEQRGATVEGSKSNQGFTTCSVDLYDFAAATIKLRLLGRKHSVTTKERTFCPNCRGGVKPYDNWCIRCGNDLR